MSPFRSSESESTKASARVCVAEAESSSSSLSWRDDELEDEREETLGVRRRLFMLRDGGGRGIDSTIGEDERDERMERAGEESRCCCRR